MKRKKAQAVKSGVSDHGKRAFFVVLFLFLLTAISPLKAFFVWLDLKSVDLFFALKPIIAPQEIEHQTLVIAKDQTFFDRFGRDPDRGDYAQLLSLIANAGVKIAAFDLIFDQSANPETDRQFAQALAEISCSILAQHHVSRGQQTFEQLNIVDEKANRPPWPLPLHKDFAANSTLKGSINIIPDFDSTIRYLPLAFHPDEKEEFLPTLGYSAYIAWLFSKNDARINQIVTNFAGKSGHELAKKLIELAPNQFNSSGHSGLDQMTRRLEAKLIISRISKLRPDLKVDQEAAVFLKQALPDVNTWLELPRQKLPLLGNFHQPCLRINFNKLPPPVNSDGIEQISMGTLLTTKSDRENANRLFLPDLVVDEKTPSFFQADFAWVNDGTARISGRILPLASATLPTEIEVHAIMVDSGYWKTTNAAADGKFILSDLPAGNYVLKVIFRYHSGWQKSSCSIKLSEGENLQLPALYYTSPTVAVRLPQVKLPSDSQLCFFGEAIHLIKSGIDGYFPEPPPKFSMFPVEDNVEIASYSNNRLISSDGTPISQKIIAVLPNEEFWNHSFLFKFAATDMLYLPPSLDCRLAIFSRKAKVKEQKNLDLSILPGSTTILQKLPEISYKADINKKMVFKTSSELEKIYLLSETENFLSVTSNKEVLLKGGKYQIYAQQGEKKARIKKALSRLQNRVVFIGTSLKEDQDLVSTPINFFDPNFPVIPGVHLHANLFSALARQDYLGAIFFHSDRSPNYWNLLQAILVLPILYLANLVFFRKGAFWGGITIIFAAFSWSVLSFLSFLNGILLPLFFPLLNLALFGVIRGYYAWEISRRKESETRSTFGRFISSAVVEEILKTPENLKPGGEKKELTVMFTDLAGFTTISEKLAPEQLTELMNEYLGEMTNLLFKYHGTLDKYIGDAIMAFWNHPKTQDNHPELAANCVLAMQKKLAELRQAWLSKGLPDVQVRAGINTSTCMVGFIGSDVQMNFTCLGDGVNLASRLEGANKSYGTLNMISESVFLRLDQNVFSTRFLDYLAVKGKDQPIKVYELRGLLSDEKKDWLKARTFYQDGVELYLQRDWDKAIENFKKVIELVPEDQPAQIFIERCFQFKIAPPPEKWDGRFILKTK